MSAFPAITLWQPWATLVAEGCKAYEFRSWAAPSRLWGKRIAIHAGARPARSLEIQELVFQLQGRHWRETGLARERSLEILEPLMRLPKVLPLSSVVCLATLGEPVSGAELMQQLGLPHLNDSDRDEHTNFGWPLTEIERLSPFIPARGALGWWTWTMPDSGIAHV